MGLKYLLILITIPAITYTKFIIKENIVINTNLGMANTFNKFFNNIGSELDNEIPISLRPGGPKCYLGPRIPYSFLIAPTNPKEICDIIKTLDEHKSSGPCSIPTKMLNLVRNELSLSFSDICNTSVKEGNPFL